MATSISVISIVDEVLRNDNYDDWRCCMQSYLLAQDLWDIIETTDQEGEGSVGSRSSRKGKGLSFTRRNAATLHAIQISCSPQIRSKIRDTTLARTAWNTLANLYQQQHSPNHIAGVINYETGSLVCLYKYADKGDWHAMRSHLTLYPNAKTATMKPYGETALHVAANGGHLKFVEELVEELSDKELEIQDGEGNTALLNTATVGITKMAESMVRKNRNLVKIANASGIIPLVEACNRSHKDIALYLYSVTPLEFLYNEDDGKLGSYFIQCAIGAGMLDIAFDFLRRFPRMTTTLDIEDMSPLYYLSKKPQLFPSGCRLAFWQRWIYSFVHIRSTVATDDVRIYVTDQSQNTQKQNIEEGPLRGLIISFFTLLGIKRIYDLKLTHFYSDKILHCMCKYASDLDYEEFETGNIYEAFQNAAENDMVEFVVEVVKAHPQIMQSADDDGRNFFMSSIRNRREKVFSLFYGLEARKQRFSSVIDGSKNTMLHLAAKLSPSSQLVDISGAALQMQRELQWYKEVESIIDPILKDYLNKDGEKARDLFTKQHRALLVKGEEWMKQAASSCTVVGALIITIMFAAAFSVPGGNDQKTGYPIFQYKRSFNFFWVSDAISLFSSSTSVLMFLGILTSRYAEEDFLWSLPTKLIIGLSTLFVSIAAMMVAFSAALIIMLHGRLEIVVPIVLFAAVPVTLFMMLQFPLLVEICVSTYGPGIFDRKMKRWY